MCMPFRLMERICPLGRMWADPPPLRETCLPGAVWLMFVCPPAVVPRPPVIVPCPVFVVPCPAVVVPCPAVIVPCPAVVVPCPATAVPCPATAVPCPATAEIGRASCREKMEI